MSAYIASLRPTLRDLRAHLWRSIAGILLVTIPVAVVSFNIAMDQSRMSLSDLRADTTVVESLGGQCKQDITGYNYECSNESDARTDPRSEARIFGARAQLEPVATAEALATIDGRNTTLQITHIPDNQALERAPSLNPGEIIIGEGSAGRLGLRPGDTLRVTENRLIDSTRAATTTLTVKSISPGWDSFVLIGSLLSVDDVAQSANTQWVLRDAETPSWSTVKQANARGMVVQSEAVMESASDIPDEELYPGFDLKDFNSSYAAESVMWLFISFTFILILLLIMMSVITPVFAIAATKQAEVYAQMRTQGASRRHIRLAVLSYGLVTALIGATLGLVIGLGTFFFRWTYLFPDFSLDFAPLLQLLVFVTAVAGGIGAAYVPALLASRGSPIAGVTLNRSDQILRWHKWMTIGPVLLLLSIIGAIALHSLPHSSEAVAYSSGDTVMALAAIQFLLTVGGILGLIGCVPGLIYLAGLIRKPLSARLAARLVRRQALRSSSIVMALLAIATITTFLTVAGLGYSSPWRVVEAKTFSETLVTIGSATEKTSPDIASALSARDENIEKVVAGATITPLPTLTTSDWSDFSLEIADGCRAHDWSHFSYQGQSPTDSPEAARHCRHKILNPTVNLQSGISTIVLGEADNGILDLFTLSPEQRARAADVLAAGGVLGSSAIVHEGATADFILSELPQDEGVHTIGRAQLPFAAVLPEFYNGWILSPQAAQALIQQNQTIKFDTSTYAVNFPEIPSSKILNKISEMVDDYYYTSYFPESQFQAEYLYLAALFIVIVALMIILAAPTMRQQNEQLFTLGAAPKLLSAISAFYGIITTLLATIPALILGHGLGYILLDSSEYDINGELISLGGRGLYQGSWPIVILFLLVLPAVAGLLGAFLGRPRDLVKYRQD
ncbi:hypothetical protein N7326_04350 [Corynebacterium sp. ES2794-CONJ1]|uniref:ABC transporter permease n=1 Tax=unclassified Corynebacterium TaxID=2624378 RepID=UPI00216B4CF5|nr:MULTISPECIES: FtsX-like permease family protein [unclassified Corynebacterium]MCS4531708.1 hypothetical protein [Corynebacterium sp. ES2730-CONJ]MCU9519104.1 hypothetical protein [Corynebacterium sp. ES2794-CONJ1]